MAKQIEVSDRTYEAIASLMSEDDTAGTVISRLVAHASLPDDSLNEITSSPDDLNFHLAAVPDLTFAKVISATLNGEPIRATKWKTLRDSIIALGVKNGVNMNNISSVRTVIGRKVDEGFEFHEVLNMSIQGQSAKDSWKTCSDICTLIDAKIEVLIQWRDNEKAAYPGKKARLLIP